MGHGEPAGKKFLLFNYISKNCQAGLERSTLLIRRMAALTGLERNHVGMITAGRLCWRQSGVVPKTPVWRRSCYFRFVIEAFRNFCGAQRSPEGSLSRRRSDAPEARSTLTMR